jgi:hypothetical protein
VYNAIFPVKSRANACVQRVRMSIATPSLVAVCPPGYRARVM